MNETSLSENNENADETFAALAKAVSEGNTEEINRLMALEGELKESENADEPEAEEPEGEVVETTDETASKEEEETAEPEKAESKQSETTATQTKTDPEAAPPAASTPTKDDEIAELKRELHALRSDAGRMRHVQSRMHQLENELRAYRARASNPNEKTAAKPELPAKLNDKLKSLKEIDPDLAETFEAVIGMVQETKQSAEEVVSSKLQEDKEQEFYAQQYAELTTAIPQAPQVFASEEWKQWKTTLTPGQRAMAESGYAVDVIRAIHAFAADMKALHGQGASQSGTASEGGDPQTKTSVPTQQPAQPNPEVTEARQRKLQTTAAVKTPAAKQVVELDEQALYSEYYKELAKKNHIK